MSTNTISTLLNPIRSKLRSYEQPIYYTFLVACTLVLTLLSLRWMGFDLQLFSRAYIGGVGDPLLNSWAIYQGIYNLSHWPINLGYSTIFYNDSASFAYTIAPYGISLTMLPVFFIFGQNMELTYNTYYILTFILTAWSASIIIKYLLAPGYIISSIAALIVAFSQFRFLHAGHIETLSTQFLLISIYLLHRLIDQPHWKLSLLLSISFWFCLLTSGYLGVIFVIASTIITAFIYIYIAPHHRNKIIQQLIVAGGLAAIFCLPFLLFRLQNEAASSGQSFEQSLVYSAKLEGWLSGTSHIYRQATPFQGEGAVFIGFVPIILSLMAWRSRDILDRFESLMPRTLSRRDVVVLYAVITVFGYILSLGPVLQVGDTKSVPLPYILLMQIPVFSWIRVPARFILLAVLGTSILSSALLYVVWKTRTFVTASIMTTCLVVLLLAELIPANGDGSGNLVTSLRRKAIFSGGPLQGVVFDKQAPAYRWLAEQPPGTPVMHYPITGDASYTYYAYLPVHQQPMLNGGGSFLPTWFVSANWSAFPDQQTIHLLQERNIRYILIHRDLLSQAEKEALGRRWQEYESSYGAFERVVTFGEVDIYRVPLVR